MVCLGKGTFFHSFGQCDVNGVFKKMDLPSFCQGHINSIFKKRELLSQFLFCLAKWAFLICVCVCVSLLSAEGLYFADQRVPENPSEILNNVRFLHPRTELMNDGYAVQSTAYALLALINNSGPKLHRDHLMMWLSTMRNTVGGFASTQVGPCLSSASVYSNSHQTRL